MKCTTTKEQLLAPIGHADKTTGKNLTVPVLACLLLEVTDTVLTVTATNLEVGVRHSLPVADAEAGRVAVPGSVLLHVLGALPSGASLTLTKEGGFLVVTSVSGETRIAVQDADEFPTLPKVEGGVELTLPAEALTTALTSVSYCASGSTIKPELASVFVHPNGGTLVTVATDSFRLAEKRVPMKRPLSADPFLVPARSVHDLLRVLQDVKGDIVLTVGEHQLSLAHKGVYVTLRLTQGTFPDYTQIIPKEFVAEATMLVADLERVLKKASAFSDQFNQTTVSVDPNAKKFTLHTENSTIGETTDTIAAALEGDELEVRFNQRYLLDALHSVYTDSVVLQFSGQSTPALVRQVGDDSFLYLVMPMNR